jgi:predicted metal-dependent HD superfamily phosphohydrolase
MTPLHSSVLQIMHLQWQSLCTRISSQLSDNILFDTIARSYSEPQRFYHTIEHLANCLRELENVRNSLKFPDAVKWALWFHDLVYDPRASDNEEQSAYISESTLRAAHVDPSFISTTTELILATRHNHMPSDSDTCYLVDIDLSIFGTDPVVFTEYENNVRREYAWVPESLYRTKRAEILTSFLHRTHIYHTDFFRTRYEQQARKNLQWSIHQLTSA